MKRTLIIAAFAAVACNAFAGVTVLTSRPAGTDDLNWAQLGNDGDAVADGSIANTVGTPFKVKVTSDDDMVRYDQSGIWSGNFTPGDNLLFTYGSTLQLLGEKTCIDMGANIQANWYGEFVARITAYDGLDNVLGSFTVSGVASDAADGSAPFLGVHSDSGDIHRVVYSLDSAVNGNTEFAINNVTYNCCAPVPEPASMSILGLGAAALLRRKAKKA